MLKAITTDHQITSFVHHANQANETFEGAQMVAKQALLDANTESSEEMFSKIVKAFREGLIVEIDVIVCTESEYQERLSSEMDQWSEVVPESDTVSKSITVHSVKMDKQCYLDALELDVFSMPSTSLLAICEHKAKRVKIACRN